MSAKSALYVDAGYLLGAAATRVTGTSLRSGINVKFAELVRGLVAQVEAASGAAMLRVHWYDAAREGIPDTQQERIGELPWVKLRLGRFGMDGQQKGVDLRIGLDLVNNARNRTADVFYLLSGDDDLSEAVEEAQAHGVQVVVLAVPGQTGKPHGVSRHLVRAADSVLLIQPATIDAAVLRVELPAEVVEVAPEQPAVAVQVVEPEVQRAATPADLQRARVPQAAPRSVMAWSSSDHGHYLAQPTSVSDIEEQQIAIAVRNVVQSYRDSASVADFAALQQSKPTIPRELDRALLVDLAAMLGVYDLNDPVRIRLRDCFWEAVGG